MDELGFEFLGNRPKRTQKGAEMEPRGIPRGLGSESEDFEIGGKGCPSDSSAGKVDFRMFSRFAENGFLRVLVGEG